MDDAGMTEGSVAYLFWLRLVLRRYLAGLLAEEVPLTASLSVACVLADLCALAGLPVPPEVERALALPQRRELAQRVIAGSGE